MKKLLFLLSLVTLLTLGFSNKSTAQNIFYNSVSTYNNDTKFVFTYDTHNQCNNNIRVTNNRNYRNTFNFSVYLDGYLKYKGRTTLSPYGSLFFNNAFFHCSSSKSFIRVYCW